MTDIPDSNSSEHNMDKQPLTLDTDAMPSLGLHLANSPDNMGTPIITISTPTTPCTPTSEDSKDDGEQLPVSPESGINTANSDEPVHSLAEGVKEVFMAKLLRMKDKTSQLDYLSIATIIFFILLESAISTLAAWCSLCAGRDMLSRKLKSASINNKSKVEVADFIKLWDHSGPAVLPYLWALGFVSAVIAWRKGAGLQAWLRFIGQNHVRDELIPINKIVKDPSEHNKAKTIVSTLIDENGSINDKYKSLLEDLMSELNPWGRILRPSDAAESTSNKAIGAPVATDTALDRCDGGFRNDGDDETGSVEAEDMATNSPDWWNIPE